MSIRFEQLWALTLGWLIGDFLWQPIFGGDLSENLRGTFEVAYFIAMAWCFEKFRAALSPADRGPADV